MKLYSTLLTSTLLISSASMAASSIPVNLKEGNQNYQGTLFYPDQAKGALPLVVVVHEWWGKTEYPEMRGKKIADELGYAALVVDLYGEGKTVSTPKEAQDLATPFYQDGQLGVKRIEAYIAAAGVAAKKEKLNLDLGHLAAIGYCFGGSQVLNLGRAGELPADEKLLAVVSFHGGLAPLLKPKDKLQTEFLVLHGGADQMVKPEDVKAFQTDMKNAGAKLEFHAYPGASHAFTNPKATDIGKKYQIPIAYDAKADQDSWMRMKTLLKKVFGR